jgi:sigma-B regulation protein RsbU (phosphoserine phosphatase)
MQSALLFLSDNLDLPLAVRSLLLIQELHPVDVDAETLPGALLQGDCGLLVLDGALFAAMDSAGRSRLASRCRQQDVPCLLIEHYGDPPPGHLPWTCGRIHNLHDLNEWGEKLELYLHLTDLEREVSGLRRRVDSHCQENDEDMRSAAVIQQSLLPKHLPALDRFRFVWKFLPYEKIGGDLFNVLQIDEENLMAFLLDVSGHGISSAMATVSINQRLSLHTGQLVKRHIDAPPFYQLLSPAEVITELAVEYPFERFEKFFTIVYLLINIRTGQLTYCSAGHPPPLLLHADGSFERLSQGGGLIGLVETGPYGQEELTLKPGDRLYLFSDGLLDQANASGESFGDERLVSVLTANGRGLEACCQGAVETLRAYAGEVPAQDDVSLLGIEYCG